MSRKITEVGLVTSLSNTETIFVNSNGKLKQIQKNNLIPQVEGGGSPGENGATFTPLDIYPIGSIYMSVNDTSPAMLFGGTWERIKDTFLLSAGDTYAAGEEGGEAEHTLSVAEMPKHRHLPGNVGTAGSESDHARCFMTALSVNSDSVYRTEVDTAASDIYTIVAKIADDITTTATTTYEGENAPHNNMPPYLTVYMWKRIP